MNPRNLIGKTFRLKRTIRPKTWEQGMLCECVSVQSPYRKAKEVVIDAKRGRERLLIFLNDLIPVSEYDPVGFHLIK